MDLTLLSLSIKVFEFEFSFTFFVHFLLCFLSPQEWTDEKMRWEPEEYNGLKVLRIPCKHIWKPDIVLYNRQVH